MASGEERVDGVRIVVLDTIEEYRETLALQEAVWGFSPTDQVPPRLFTVSKMIGGVVLGVILAATLIWAWLRAPEQFRILRSNAGPLLHANLATGVQPIERPEVTVDWFAPPVDQYQSRHCHSCRSLLRPPKPQAL